MVNNNYLTPHGCIGCKRCPTYHCTICTPCKRIPVASGNPIKNNYHLHDWQETNNYFICRLCGLNKKKEAGK